MSQPIYLDYARFGAILPDCASMLRQYVDLLAGLGQFPQFDEFLNRGATVWPESMRQQFPLLARWQGLEPLRDQVRQLCGVTGPSTVLFSGSSTQLARIAVQLMLDHCETILRTDQDWPDFGRILEQQTALAGGLCHTINLKELIRPGRPPEIVDQPCRAIARAFTKKKCDGLLLTTVSHEGVHLPLPEIISQLDESNRPSYVIVAGAQHAGHRPIDLGPDFRGVFLAGTHKWLCSGVPLSFAVIVHGPDVDMEIRQLRKAIRTSIFDDMLLLRTADLGLSPPEQTMRLEPLLAAGLALQHELEQDADVSLLTRRENAAFLVNMAHELHVPMSDLQSRGGIAYFGCTEDAHDVRRILYEYQVTVSALNDQILRVSCPATPFTPDQQRRLEVAFGSLEQLHAHLFR